MQAAERELVIGVSPDSSRRDAAAAGLRAITPLVIGLVPLALTVGTAAARAGLPPLVGWASSPLLYGASGQLTWLQALGGGAPTALVVGETVMVNLQMVLYGATMRPYWTAQSRGWRLLAGHLLVGPVFGVAITHHRRENDPALRNAFYTAAGVTLWVAWLVLTGVGYVCGGLPSVPVVLLLAPLVMVSLALRTVRDGATMTSLIVASAVAVAAANAPYDAGFLAAAVCGVLAGAAVDSTAWGRHALVRSAP